MSGAAGSTMREARRFGSAAVASPHYLASAAGAELLAQGANALDAVVAANLALGVVAPYYCGYGGDLLAMVWDGDVHGYRSVGRAAAGATPAAVRAATGSAEMPVFGPHTVTVPGAVQGWFALLERWGSRDFATVAAPARRLAEAGFPLTRRGAQTFGAIRLLHADAPDLLAAYPPVEPGDWIAQPALARTIATLGADGPDAYYRGPIGAAIAATVERHGGALRSDDLAGHADAWVEPLRGGFAGRSVCELPPPTQGVAALQMLGIVERLDLPGPGPERDHLLVEAVKLALAERDDHVGDPDAMATTPDALLADERIGALAARVDPAAAAPATPRTGPEGDTAYLCAADRDGLAVSLIQSNFSAIGSGLHVPEWGINLQNRGSSFTLVPGHVNELAPGKLPMHTLIPALLLADGEPELVFGTMGAHAQAQVHLQLLVRLLLDGEELQRALGAPRWFVEPTTATVAGERRLGDDWFAAMESKGHRVRRARAFDDGAGHAHAIRPDRPGCSVATDPRAEGAALGA